MKIAFVSVMEASSWGGSELLWSQAAEYLSRCGHNVLACVKHWSKPSPTLHRLAHNGVKVATRKHHALNKPLITRLTNKLLAPRDLGNQLNGWNIIQAFSPDLVCISQGAVDCGRHWALQCHNVGQPYVLIAHSNNDRYWPSDTELDALQLAYLRSRRNFFVSYANKNLLELQIGATLPNAEVIRNPFAVPYNDPPDWPSNTTMTRFACVARLDPRSKGQDLLICALSSNEWRERSWFLSFYGEGPYTAVLKKLVQCNDLSSKVGFCGYLADVRKIWEDNHALILPSRSEGLPLALVEASLSNRVSIVTDVAGNTELIVDNISGFVAPSPTINHLQEAMERAWCNQGNWRLMGHRAGDLARQNISPNPAMVFAERLVELV